MRDSHLEKVIQNHLVTYIKKNKEKKTCLQIYYNTPSKRQSVAKDFDCDTADLEQSGANTKKVGRS